MDGVKVVSGSMAMTVGAAHTSVCAKDRNWWRALVNM